jgi:ATP-dependent Clp protease, protease subunit
MTTQTWYNIAPKGETEAEISIYDSIGGYEINAKQFADDLKALDVQTIHLRINSPGGSVIDGNAIFNALQRHSAKVITHIDGLAASMASVIAMAGDEIRMADNALLMIHNPWTFSMGDADDLRADADLLDKMRDIIVGAYGRSQYNAEELKDLMDAETWMTAQEALDAGFIDTIETGLRAAAELSATAAIGGIKVPAEKQIAAMAKQIEALDNVASELAGKLDAKAQELVTVSAELVDARAEVEAAQLVNADFENRVNELQGELTVNCADIERMKAEIEAAKIVTDEAVAQKAAELVQSNTHAPISEDDADATAKTADALLEEYSKLTDHVARRDFRAKHKDQFSKLIKG